MKKKNGIDMMKMPYLVLIFVVIELTNIILKGSELNMFLSIPQFIYVLYLLGRENIKRACLFHITFTLLSFNATSALNNELVLFSYAKLKLIGPLTMSYLIGGLLCLIVIRRYPIEIGKNILFYKCYQIIRYILLSGILIGLIGITVFDYKFVFFVDPVVYILNAYIYCEIFVRLYSAEFIRKCYNVAIGLLIASPITTFVTFFVVGIRAEYSEFDALVINEVYRFSPCLLLVLIEKNSYKGLILISMFCYFSNTIIAGRGTDYLIVFIVVLSYLIILNFTERGKNYPHYYTVKFFIMPILLLVLGSLAAHLLTSEGLAGNKIRQFVSLANIFSIIDLGSGSMDVIGRSPYIRIAEFANIIYESVQQPIWGLFGKGYGGTYTDSLNLLGGANLTLGGFSEEIVIKGRFPNAHFAIPNIILYNGIIGLILIIRLTWFYIKEIPSSPLAITAIVFFLFNFYFNPLLGIASVFILYSAQYNIQIRNTSERKYLIS